MQTDTMHDLGIAITQIEEEVMALTRKHLLAESELRLAKVRRHELHRRYSAAVAEQDELLRQARAC